MDSAERYDDIVTRLKTLMKDTFGDYFNNYYEGDPIQIPKSNLPCVIIEKLRGDVKISATGTDDFGSQLNIRLVLDKADDFGIDDSVDTTERKLRLLVEGRDPVTGNYLPNTVLGALRTKITLGGNALSNQSDISYDLQPRPGKIVTSEALVQIVTRERVFVPDRI
jgi:hypothetical protein